MWKAKHRAFPPSAWRCSACCMANSLNRCVTRCHIFTKRHMQALSAQTGGDAGKETTGQSFGQGL